MKKSLIKKIIASVTLGSLSGSVAFAEGNSNLPGPRTPHIIDDVFSGFVMTALTGATIAPGPEIFPVPNINEPFYKEPKLSGNEKPGTIIKSAKVQVQYTGVRPANLRAYRLMYVTTGLDGSKDISTGTLMVPNDGKDDSKRPLIEYQEANDSVGAFCHPSSQWVGENPLDGSSMSALGPLAQMFNKGAAVMITDVGNNGDLSPHGIFAGKYGGMTALDGARAALNLKEVGLSKNAKIGLFGIAGGGVGAAFAAELAPKYSPDLNIKSVVLQGMVINQKSFLEKSNNGVGAGFAFATLVGLDPQYPKMQLDKHLNSEGLAKANYYRTQCQVPAYFDMPFKNLNSLFKNNQNPANIPAFQHVFEDNILGKKAPKAKVLISSCKADDSFMSLVPAKDSKDLANKYRSMGTKVDYYPSNCSDVNMLINIYGWGTDLFGMQNIDWLFETLK